MQSSPALRRSTVVTAATLAGLFVIHILAVCATLRRPTSQDESQYLHVGWLMAQGDRLYQDFAEDHSPFLFTILKELVPAESAHFDGLLYAARARIVTSACGVLTLAALVAFGYRATRSLVAPIITVSVLLATSWAWFAGLSDIRNDPPALFLFWLGAFLLSTRRENAALRFVLAGAGIGLVAVAALWNPKMPLECVVLGVVYLWKLRDAFRYGARMIALAIVPPVAAVTSAVLFIASTVSIRDYAFFTFHYNKIIFDFQSSTHFANQYFQNGQPFLYCDSAFKGVWPILAIAVAALILFIPRLRRLLSDVDISACAIVFALVIAAALEIRFVFPYPNLWHQYYLVWDFALAMLYGMTAAISLRILGNVRFEAAIQVSVAVVAVVLVQLALPSRTNPFWWESRSSLLGRLRPRETVWLVQTVHPIAARDASYYWFGFPDLVPASLHYTATHPGASPLPAMREEDLPVCRAERGLDPSLRFVVGPRGLEGLPIAAACLQRMIASGRAARVLTGDIWDLHPAPPAVR